MHVLALEVELRLPLAESLKDKRRVVLSLTEATRRRFEVSAAEVAAVDDHRRAVLGFAAVGASPDHLSSVIDRVEDFVWSNQSAEVVDARRLWLDDA